jgi:uncharacterized membrane protein
VILNSGAIVAGVVFDAYPYSLLGIILAIEAILITSFVLISQNHQNAHQDQRAELDYEVNVNLSQARRDLGCAGQGDGTAGCAGNEGARQVM